ncbi:MAG TPA: SDR family oxidoreductase [Acidimicrobiales bacterium]
MASPMHELRRSPTRGTVLLTGASGLVGQALLDALGHHDVICLSHRTPVNRPGVATVHGDLMQPNLGLDDDEYRSLAKSIDAIIHCAAVTDFNRRDGSLETTNVQGTEKIVALADAADARLYHVSTAFLHAKADGDRGRTAVGYADSKRAAEDLVQASSVPHVMLRPSVVIGDSRTGAVSAFQGLYLVAGAIFAGLVPLIPFDPTWPIDFLPCDVVADAIAAVVDHELTSGEFWITAGTKALSLDRAVGLCVGLANELGKPVDKPRFVPPEMFDRLIAPVFLESLPLRIRRTVVRLLDFFAAYLCLDGALPSDLDRMGELGAKPLPDQEATLLTSLRYWAEATRKVKRPRAEVA